MDDIFHGGVVDGSIKGKVGQQSRTALGKYNHGIEIAVGEEVDVGKFLASRSQ